MALPITIPRLKLTMGGGLPANEQWQVGFWFDMQTTTGINAQNLAAWLNSIQTGILAQWVGTLRSYAGTGSSYNSLRGYYYGAGDTTARIVAAATAFSSPGQGGQTMPNQVAIVASLLSGQAGRNARGRVYWPLLAASLSNDSLAQSDCSAIAGATASILAAARQVSLGGGNPLPAVLPNVPVLNVRVDGVPDTQRRRRRSVLATVSATAAVPVG